MIIHGPHDNAEYDEDIGPIVLSDWYHSDYYEIVKDVMAPETEGKKPPMSNNNLINGKMNYPCQSNQTTCTPNASVSKFKFESCKTYRIRLINSGAEGMQKFSIDNHIMTIIANAFVPVVPYNVDVVILGIGQRTDIIVKATGRPTDAVWMRSTLGKSAFVGGCNLLDGISPEAVAAIHYQNVNNTAVPTTKSAVFKSAIDNCANDPLIAAVPYYKITPDPEPPVTKEIDIAFQSNGTHKLWFVNNSTFRANFNDPILLETNLGRFDDFKPEYSVINFYDNSSIQIIVYNHAFAGSHP
jgi:FtsP/CotA-like multicopper oxidase with cupredoxin domain